MNKMTIPSLPKMMAHYDELKRSGVATPEDFSVLADSGNSIMEQFLVDEQVLPEEEHNKALRRILLDGHPFEIQAVKNQPFLSSYAVLAKSDIMGKYAGLFAAKTSQDPIEWTRLYFYYLDDKSFNRTPSMMTIPSFDKDSIKRIFNDFNIMTKASSYISLCRHLAALGDYSITKALIRKRKVMRDMDYTRSFALLALDSKSGDFVDFTCRNIIAKGHMTNQVFDWAGLLTILLDSDLVSDSTVRQWINLIEEDPHDINSFLSSLANTKQSGSCNRISRLFNFDENLPFAFKRQLVLTELDVKLSEMDHDGSIRTFNMGSLVSH